MTSVRRDIGNPGRPRDRASLPARRPEVLPVSAAAIAWVVLLVVPDAGGHDGHGGMLSATGVALLAVMTTAMMAPLAVPGGRTVAMESLWWRAGRAVAWFLFFFLLTWTVFAVCLAPIAQALGGVLGSPQLAAGLLTAACAAAQLDPGRALAMQACERPMRLRDKGSDANSDCARFGILCAYRGLRICALPMLAMLAMPSSLLLMAALTTAVATDRMTHGRHRLVIGVLYLILAVSVVIFGGSR